MSWFFREPFMTNLFERLSLYVLRTLLGDSLFDVVRSTIPRLNPLRLSVLPTVVDQFPMLGILHDRQSVGDRVISLLLIDRLLHLLFEI